MTKEKQFEALMSRGIFDEIIPSPDAFKKRVLSDKPLSIYLGIDATAKSIHLGHVQNILVLEDLRRMGVMVNLLFGGFTTRIGDPSGRSTARPKLSEASIAQNIREFVKQTRPILKTGWQSGAKIVNNNKWTGPMQAAQVIEIASNITIQQLLNRDSFQKRIKSGRPLWTHEVLYPLFQGYDSVAMDIDAELCGSDQLFNALVGRDLVAHYLKKEKFVLTTKLIQDADTGLLMSKSTGTGAFVDVEKGGEDNMFGEILSLPDGFIGPLYKGATRVPMDVVEAQLKKCTDGKKTKEVKMDLAEHIVGVFHGADLAKKAREHFVTQFSQHRAHENTPEVKVASPVTVVEFLTDVAGMAPSRATAKRLIKEGAVYVDDIKIETHDMVVDPAKHSVARTGRKMVRIVKE